MNKRGQLQIFFQPKFLILILAILGGFLIGNKFNSGTYGALAGLIIALLLWRYLW